MKQTTKDPRSTEDSASGGAETSRRAPREAKSLDEPPPDQGTTKGGLPGFGD